MRLFTDHQGNGNRKTQNAEPVISKPNDFQMQMMNFVEFVSEGSVAELNWFSLFQIGMMSILLLPSTCRKAIHRQIVFSFTAKLPLYSPVSERTWFECLHLHEKINASNCNLNCFEKRK